MDNLGGASFKVTADAAAFMKGMDEAEKKAVASSKAISTSIVQASQAVEGYAVALTKTEKESDRAVQAAMEITTAQKLMRQSLEETTVAERSMATALANFRPQAMGASTAMVTMQGSTRSSALGFLYLSQAIEDAQYGFSAIVNNIPLIVMGMGGGPGIAGAVSIAAVAVNLLINHWKDLMSAFQTPFERQAVEALERLKERAKEAAEAFERLAKAPTEMEAKGVKKFEEGFKGKDIQQLQQHVAQTILQQREIERPHVIADDPNDTRPEWIKALGKKATEKIIGHRIARTEQEASEIHGEMAMKKAAEILGQTEQADPAGAAARDHLKRLIKANPKAFTDEEKQKIESADPVKIKAQEEAEERWKGFHKGEEEMKKVRKHDEDSVKEQIKKEVEARKHGIREGAEEQKRLRLQDLEDKRDAIMKEKHQIAEDLYSRTHDQRAGQVLAGGAKAAVDMYQSSVVGADNPKELAKRAHKLQEDANKRLASIDEQMKKERRVILPK